MPDIDETLAERGSRYSDFRDNALVAQDLKEVFRDSPNWKRLPGYMQEGLDMFASKISRMLTGDMFYDDNIHDIIGYAKLMQDRMAEDRANPMPLMPDAVTFPEMKPIEPLELPTLDLGDFKEEVELPADIAEPDTQLRQDMWDDHRGHVAWGYTANPDVAAEYDRMLADNPSEKIDWLQENVLAGNVDLYTMRQEDVAGVFALGAFEIPKN